MGFWSDLKGGLNSVVETAKTTLGATKPTDAADSEAKCLTHEQRDIVQNNLSWEEAFKKYGTSKALGFGSNAVIAGSSNLTTSVKEVLETYGTGDGSPTPARDQAVDRSFHTCPAPPRTPMSAEKFIEVRSPVGATK